MISAPPIPAVLMRARRNVIDHLKEAGATSAENAVTYLPTRRTDRKARTYLQQRGIVGLADGGRYWVDEQKAAAWERSNKKMMAVAIAGSMAAVAAVLAIVR